MVKLPMCRVCLAGNVRMYVVVNRKLRELYEKLTDNPFVTEDSRPMLACFFCCTKLKQCYQFQRKCLEAEELFAQMINEGYEGIPVINQDHSEFCNGLIQTSVEVISIVSECQIENIAIKEELPAVFEGLDDNIEPKEEPQIDELELENQENSDLYVEDIPALHSECDSEDPEDDKPLMEFKIELEEHVVSRNKRRASDTQRASVAKKPILDTRRPKPRDTIPTEQKKNEYNQKLSSVSEITMKSQNHSSNRTSKFEKLFTKTQNGVCGSIDNTALSTSFRNSRNRDNITCKISNKDIDSDKIKRYLCVNEKHFECDICQRSFNHKSNIINHIRSHTIKKPFKCNIFQRSFNRKNSLVNNHTAGGEKPFKCDICQCSFNQKYKLVSHTISHTGVKPFKCDICQRSFKRKSHVICHIRSHTGEKRFKCDICQRMFNQKSNLVSHTSSHTGHKPFKCDICQRSFKLKSHVIYHIRTHTGEKPFKCDICQRSFNHKNHLVSHSRTHTGEKPFNCDICQRSFNQKVNLETHTRTHTGEKPFNCDICQRRFGHKSLLVNHTRIHTGEKPFNCEICQRSFSQKRYLVNHTRTHTGEKPFKCDICKRSFIQKSILVRHTRTHTGKKTFQM